MKVRGSTAPPLVGDPPSGRGPPSASAGRVDGSLSEKCPRGQLVKRAVGALASVRGWAQPSSRTGQGAPLCPFGFTNRVGKARVAAPHTSPHTPNKNPKNP
jgi:hypothetical protein